MRNINWNGRKKTRLELLEEAAIGNCAIGLKESGLGGVYMTPERLSCWGEFTPVPSHSSTFVYMIPPHNVTPARVAAA